MAQHSSLSMQSLVQIIKGNSFFTTLLHSRNYFLSSLAVNAMGFISLPVMTRLLSPSDYGILNVFTSYQAIFVTLFTLNCHVALGRYYFEEQDDFKEFFGTSILFVSALLFVCTIFLVIFRKDLAGLLGLPNTVILCFIPIVLFYVFSSWFEQIYGARRESGKIAIRNVLTSYSIFGLAIVIILSLKNDKYLGQIYASLIIGGLASVYYFFQFKPFLRWSFNLRAIRYTLLYAVPLIPYSLSGVILAQFDRIMVNKYSGSSDAGLYSFAYNIGMLLPVVLSALHQAWGPEYFKHMGEKNYQQLDADIIKIITVVTVAAFFLIVFGKDMGMILGKETFHASLAIVPVVVIGYLFYAFFTFYAWNIQYAKRNIYLSVTVLAAGIANIGLNVIFLPRYGYVAAAYTTAVSYLLLAIMVWAVNKTILKLYSTPLREALRPAAILAPFVAVFYLVESSRWGIWTVNLLKALLFLTFTATLSYRYLIQLRHRPTDSHPGSPDGQQNG